MERERGRKREKEKGTEFFLATDLDLLDLDDPKKRRDSYHQRKLPAELRKLGAGLWEVTVAVVGADIGPVDG